jgi:hypothetical protein
LPPEPAAGIGTQIAWSNDDQRESYEEYLITEFAPSRLRMELDRIPLWRGDHVGLKQLWEDFTQYLYLPRLKDVSVLIGAVQSGLGLLLLEQDAFAYAESWDEAEGRSRGLRADEQGSVMVDTGLTRGRYLHPTAPHRRVLLPRAARHQLGSAQRRA